MKYDLVRSNAKWGKEMFTCVLLKFYVNWYCHNFNGHKFSKSVLNCKLKYNYPYNYVYFKKYKWIKYQTKTTQSPSIVNELHVLSVILIAYFGCHLSFWPVFNYTFKYCWLNIWSFSVFIFSYERSWCSVVRTLFWHFNHISMYI